MAFDLSGNIEILRIVELLTKVLAEADLANYYVAIDKDGVYRLSDRQKLFDIEGEATFAVRFSRDSQYVSSVGDGIYRLSDGEKMFDHENAHLSSDGSYAFVSEDGIYRLEDGQKLDGLRFDEVIDLLVHKFR